MQHNRQQRAGRKRRFARMFLGRPEDPALARAFRVAGSVVLLLLLGLALRGLLTLAGVLPEWLPFTWRAVGEQLLVKPAGTFVIVLFLHLLRWLIRARRRRLALTLVAATGPVCFGLGLLGFGAAQVFSRDWLTRDWLESGAVVAWLVLVLVPVIFLGVVLQLEPAWLRTDGRKA